MLKRSTAAIALATSLVLPGAVLAEALAFTATDLNIRTGPAASYQRFDTIEEGDRVVVHGCLTGYNWCDVSWSGERGWVSGKYLAYAGQRYARQPIPSIGVTIGVPVIGFRPNVYHRRYYVDRPWYRDYYLDTREIQRGRRELGDARRELRDERTDLFEARRDLRQERRVGNDTGAERRKLR
ncbi:SH3 domain-containing protein [Microvirga soli]|uniref:SH3 domain-containing protein n=1 Tax=Microvirga soli TaxID=1854496 RepID=UPI00191FFBDF|nr:SH3 domain-containing protein [Microvirga soli]